MEEHTHSVATCDQLHHLALDVVQGRHIHGHRPDEQRALAMILSSMSSCFHHLYPLTIVHRDKPDYFLSFRQYAIAIEVTKLQSPVQAHAKDSARRLGIGYCPTRYELKMPTLSRSEMEESLLDSSAKITDWIQIPSGKYAETILEKTERKIPLVFNDVSTTADECWLLIQDMQDTQDHELISVAPAVSAALAPKWRSTPFFSKVLLLTGTLLVDMNQRSSAYTAIHPGNTTVWHRFKPA